VLLLMIGFMCYMIFFRWCYEGVQSISRQLN
jgi:hypothetical protein